MAKVKLTKTELKAQKDALTRFNRFLPMLQLKKQQLQMEIAALRAKAEDLANEERERLDGLKAWAGLLADTSAEIPIVLDRVNLSHGNIAGVTIPVFEGIETHRPETDLFETPAWVDDAAQAAEQLMTISAKINVLHEEITRIEQELRTTSQRVNLFEKVKIPECKENIRIIGIMLGDEQTSAVARGKIAKSRDKSDGRAVAGQDEEAVA